jgi:Tol biopolymer transport system component
VRMALEEGGAEAPPRAEAHPPYWIAGVFALIAALLGFLYFRATRPPERPFMRLDVNLGADSVAGTYTTVAISPDGTRLAFPVRNADGSQQLATRLLSQAKATLLPGTLNAAEPFFSPDGQSIGFFAEGKLKSISVQGGAPVTLANAPAQRGAAWMSDGTIVATLSLNGVSRVPAGGGAPQPLVQRALTGGLSHRWPQALPGGKAILFTSEIPGSLENNASLDVLTLSTGQQNTVLRGGYFGRYLPGGYLVYMHEGVLFGVGFDLERLQVRGTPVPLLDDVACDPTIASAQFAFSETGAFVYLTGSGALQGRRLAWLDSSGTIQPLALAAGPYLWPRLSPDGSRVAMAGAPAAPLDLWVYDWQGDRMSRVTFSTNANRAPVWSPDGKHIAFGSSGYIGWVRADGAGGEQRLLETGSPALPSDISRDGRRLAFFQFSGQPNFDIWTAPLDLGDPDHPKAGKPELFLGTPAMERAPAFSPDGRWMAYESTESGNSQIYVRPFPSGSAQWQVSAGGGQFPFWSRDGRQLFYETLDNHIMVADCAAKGESFEAGKPRLWSPRRIVATYPYNNLDLHPDGKRFLVFPAADASGESASSVHATFLLNFTDELKRRIP